MRLLLNTLSIGSLSGEHVVYGFLRPLIESLAADDRLFILHYQQQPPPTDIKQNNVQTISVTNTWHNWAARFIWETLRLPRLVKTHDIDLVMNISGAITPFLTVPQVTLAMSPWCYVKETQQGRFDTFKAWLQRSGYRRAYRKAAKIFYLSAHLRELYRADNRKYKMDEKDSAVTWVGLNDELFKATEDMKDEPRKPLSILSVSVFARWKGLETLIEAVHQLHQQDQPVTLDLVGPWPHADYKQRIEQMINDYGLQRAVTIHDHVAVQDLHHFYATRQVFCLMSTCESFGIPAAEAMAFGTPVVSTNCTALQEVCEGAGLFGPKHDASWTAQALQSLLADAETWSGCSTIARQRASKLTWHECAKPLLSMQSIGCNTPNVSNTAHD